MVFRTRKLSFGRKHGLIMSAVISRLVFVMPFKPGVMNQTHQTSSCLAIHSINLPSLDFQCYLKLLVAARARLVFRRFVEVVRSRGQILALLKFSFAVFAR